MNLNAFKSYDIRGIYPTEINEELAFKVGIALVKFLNAKEVAVGYDMRKSSPSLLKHLLAGITSTGCKVKNVGMCTTPMLNFAVASKKLDGGVMITASHNPKEYNAFKIVTKSALMIHKDSGLLNIKELVEGMGKLNLTKSNYEKNLVSNYNVLPDYVTHIANKFKGVNFSNLNIVCDFSNGVGAISALPVFSKLNINSTYIYDEPNGDFPNHSSDTTNPKNYLDLIKKVKQHKANLGIFFDGDGDRASFVNEQGNIVNADITFCLLVDEYLKNYSNKKVYYDLRFTKQIVDVVNKNSGEAIKLRVGNPFYKEKLIQVGGAMASEFSGHTMFSENYSIDDGLYVSLKLMQVLSEKNKPLSHLLNTYSKYFSTPEINTHLKEDANPNDVINALAKKYSDGKHNDLDGLTVEYNNWWFNLRKSNTEPVVRLRVEADNKDLLNKKKKEILAVINTFV